MCINKQKYFNKWNHSWIYSDCGRCPACQQAKANRRTLRIKSATFDGYVTLFVTLTYRNINIPYILKNELQGNPSKINIYRDCSVRRVRSGSDYEMVYKYIRKKTVLREVDCFKYSIFPCHSSVQQLTKLRGQGDSNKVGVLFFKDLQDFLKRLRINAERHYLVKKPIYTFNCSEYGPTTLRPHFHLLISVPQENLAQLQSAIVESWPFDSRIKSTRSIEIARNAASYVSSYVNRGASFPKFLDYAPFRPKHSFSKGYGLQDSRYSLESLLDAFGRKDLRYSVSTGASSSFARFVMFPKHVCDRYFSKCYGYSRLSYDEISQLCTDPDRFFAISDVVSRMYLKTRVVHPAPSLEVSFTGDYCIDIDRIDSVKRHIRRLRSRFCHDFVYYEGGIRYVGLPENEYSYQLFADYYYRFWNVYQSTLIKSQYESCNNDVSLYQYLFDNWRDVDQFGIRSDVSAFRTMLNYDPNLYPQNVSFSLSLTDLYYKKYKRRKITNSVMFSSGFNV